jgi:subtilisin family serine protease
MQNAPKSNPTFPSFPQLVAIFLLTVWLSVASLAAAGLTILLPADWPELVADILTVVTIASLLLMPYAGFAVLVYWRDWRSLRPFAITLLATALYIIAATTIRAFSVPGSNLQTTLLLVGLTAAALVIGGGGLRLAGVPQPALGRISGLGRPPVAGLLLGFGLIAVVTIGWPLTGAWGDSWASLLILLQALAIILPAEIFFRGAILGIFTFNFQRRRAFAASMALFVYLAFLPSLLVPADDWNKLGLLITAVPLALLTTELRLVTGSIWAGILFAWLYRAAPPLFTDPRVELPLITQPWQTAAYVWQVLSTAGLAFILWLVRSVLVSRRQPTRRAVTVITLAAVLVTGLGWVGLWYLGGFPGFHNDGFLIIMAEHADLTGAEAIADPIARREFVRERLVDTAERSQAPIRAALDEAGLAYRPFYLTNMIQVEGHHRQMADFAELPGVARVMLNPNVRPYPTNVSLGYGSTSGQGQGIGWNISQVKADDVWALDITGQDIVIGGQDTGFDWQHPALREAYRGNSGGVVDHAYDWHDAWSDSAEPFDDDQHGTHTMGTILGDDGHGNQVGMAPGAQWIGCRNMLRGLGNPASYTDCMEFFMAPYPPGGDPFRDGDVSLAPHVVNNSWGCPDIEGCDDSILQPAADALRAAGIMMVVSAGNTGPGCRTVDEPPARYDSVFSVGATDNLSQITGFSSRGPVPNSAVSLKPDIVAPGSQIRSSLPGGRYGTADGTSMAGPHVAGLVALIWSARPELVGQIGATEEIIRRSATPIEVDTVCSTQQPPSGSPSLLEQIEMLDGAGTCACGEVAGRPNNVYGWGEIDALAAVELALAWESE